MTESGLKDCPFCGAPPVFKDWGGWEIHCSSKDCGASMVLAMPDKKPLIKAWNRRAIEKAHGIVGEL